MSMKSKRVCVRLEREQHAELIYLQENGGGWDPSIIIRRAIVHYAQHIREKNAAEQKRQEEFLSGKLTVKVKTPLLQRKANAKAAAK